MKKIVSGSVLLFCGLFGFSSLATESKPVLPKLAEVCSKECPGAKDNYTAHKCTEAKEFDPKFKKTKCFEAHAKYEEMTGDHHSHPEDEENSRY